MVMSTNYVADKAQIMYPSFGPYVCMADIGTKFLFHVLVCFENNAFELYNLSSDFKTANMLQIVVLLLYSMKTAHIACHILHTLSPILWKLMFIPNPFTFHLELSVRIFPFPSEFTTKTFYISLPSILTTNHKLRPYAPQHAENLHSDDPLACQK
jgi:hypothetical protein